ncbi:hypothetical protein ACC817_05735 [Rhizobium ruizarguesonis]|uniref:hypothetical protein n=1 Tax=Rhizobium ruizarguesonis TaxID=2081791 RepID=UPI0010305A2A|nr:hypothetical protein [Rhizobium ruizarguesonis]TAY73141.1 hypothetical protein ELH84_04225 [Rhizobium ruizarguesonis]
MANDLRFHGAAFRAALRAAGLALLLAVPHGAWAKDGDSGGSGSDHSGSDHSGSDDSGSGNSGSGDSGSGGHGSGDDGSDDSGSSSHSGKGSGSDDSGRGGKGKDGQERQHTYDGGWRAQIRNGRYQVFDPAGRVVINRKARVSDYRKF